MNIISLWSGQRFLVVNVKTFYNFERIVFMTKYGRAIKNGQQSQHVCACVDINNDLTVQYLQQAGTQSGGRRDMRRSMIITDCRLS